MRYTVPHGYLLVRPEAPEEQRGAIHLGVTEIQPWGIVLMRSEEMPAGYEMLAHEGDRVRFRMHTDELVTIQLPDAPDVIRCVHCGSREDDPERLENCPQNRDVRTNAALDHEFQNMGPEPETLAVIDIKNVLLVQAQP